MKKVWPVIWVLVGIALILFVMVPLAYVAVGRIANPFSLDSVTTANLSNTSGRRGMVEALAEKDTKAIDCTAPLQSLEPHVRDARLMRDGQSSTIKSEFYKLNIALEEPIVDWQYTKEVLSDEVASFVYKDVIVNTMARTAKPECTRQAATIYKDFHTKGQAVEYFSSRVYLDLGKPIGLTSAVLRNYGDASMNGNNYYWYMLDEQFGALSDKPVVTIWYSTRVGRTEYWFAFRTFKAQEGKLNDIAEEVLDSVEFLKF